MLFVSDIAIAADFFQYVQTAIGYFMISLASNCVLVVCFLLCYSTPVTNATKSLMNNASQPQSSARLEFIPKHCAILCNDLLTDSPANTFKLSKNFDLHYKKIDSEQTLRLVDRKNLLPAVSTNMSSLHV